MKKITTLLSVCLVSLLFSCSTENLNESTTSQNLENQKLTSSKFINLEELQKDNSSFTKFQQLQTDLNTLRNSDNFGTQFVFLISTNKILQTEDNKSKTFTFPIYRSSNSAIVENVVLKIGSDGSYNSYLVKYNLNDSDKNNIKNHNAVELENTTEIIHLNDLANKLNSKSTNKSILNYTSKCYELIKKKKDNTNEPNDNLMFEFSEITCDEFGGSIPYAIVDPNTLPPIISNVTYTKLENPNGYMSDPYTLGYDFSSYPILEDPLEENNYRARLFFDRLNTNMRKWALANLGLYDKILIKLTAENWDLNYEEFALNVLGQITEFHIQHWADLNPEYEAKIFNILLAGGKIIDN